MTLDSFDTYTSQMNDQVYFKMEKGMRNEVNLYVKQGHIMNKARPSEQYHYTTVDRFQFFPMSNRDTTELRLYVRLSEHADEYGF